MGTMVAKSSDVIQFLKEQHEQVKRCFAGVLETRGEERKSAFTKLRRLLAVHETAEEEIVHPAARRALPDGEAVVSARLREENEAKKVLTDLEELDVDSSEFESKLRSLEQSVVAHAEAEEREEFDRLAGELEPERLERMRKAAEIAEAVAPTRPHAGVESSIANVLVGPFASIMDRTRDLLSGKH